MFEQDCFIVAVHISRNDNIVPIEEYVYSELHPH